MTQAKVCWGKIQVHLAHAFRCYTAKSPLLLVLTAILLHFVDRGVQHMHKHTHNLDSAESGDKMHQGNAARGNLWIKFALDHS